ncbi:hypothetical protein C942_00501 [Photobacterium marinum]|uniref:Phage head-tail adaptor n=1 Tax=Photobacterium marinum TaxID=1056511 RepID=L8JEV1_9GAMM|nr:phage head closure protein [Photobacterium marinum]ELR66059.1 hypothetical protein C942_00501 [Photobacterium marinum]
MRSGKLKHVIQVYKQTKQKNESGEYVNNWQLIAKPYCEVKVLDGQEVVNGNIEIAIQTVEFKTRYSRVIEQYTPDMYIRFQNKKYDIQSVDNVNWLNRELRIVAKERR